MGMYLLVSWKLWCIMPFLLFMSICPTLLPCLAAKPSSNPISGFTLCMASTVRLPNGRSLVRISHILLNPWCDHHKIPGAFPLITIFQPHLPTNVVNPCNFRAKPLPMFGSFIHVYTIHFWWFLGIILVENQLINPENHQMVDEDGGSQGESRVPSVAGGYVFLFLYSCDIPIRCAQLFICIHTHVRIYIYIDFALYSHDIPTIIPINSHEIHIQSPSF